MSMIITWHTTPGHQHCPICSEMDGHEWVFDASVGGDPKPTSLVYDPKGLTVWDVLQDVSVAHISTNVDWECYCRLEVTFDFSQIEIAVMALSSYATAGVDVKSLESKVYYGE